MSDNKEREAFEAWREECGYNTEAFKGVLELAWRAALAHAAQSSSQSAAPAVLTMDNGAILDVVDHEQCDGCGGDLGEAYCAGCLVDEPAKWLESIKVDGYRTDNERCAAEILLKIASQPRESSSLGVALSDIRCKAFEEAFPTAADCRNKDGYHGMMAVRMEGFAAGIEAAARSLDSYVGMSKIAAGIRAILSRAASSRAEMETCIWDREDEDGAWDSQCGECWLFIDGGPKENGVKFCQGCGKQVMLAAAETKENGNG